MHRHCRLTLAGITAALFLVFAVASASANRLSMSNQNFRIVFSELKFFTEGVNRGFTKCPVTLEGSFNERTTIKSNTREIGAVTRAVVTEVACKREPLGTSEPAGILQTSLPWRLTYQGFSGTLPNITRIRVLLSNVQFDTIVSRVRCLYAENRRGISGEFIRESSGAVNRFEFDHSTRIEFSEGELFSCATEAGLEGTGEVTVLGAVTRITVTLI